MAQAKSGYTKVENYFFDHVMPRVSCVEWKTICAVIRETVGWNRDEAEISVERFMQLTGFARQAMMAGITKSRQRGSIARRTIRDGRQRTFKYRAIPHANLAALPEPAPRRKQDTLPFDVLAVAGHPSPVTSDTEEIVSQSETKFDNHTLISKFENQTSIGLTEYENQTPKLVVLRSIKERDLRERQIKNATDKTGREQQAVENYETTEKDNVSQLCRFCSSQHADPLTAPAVTLYYDRFRLMLSEGFRHDVWLTVQDLALWGRILDGWWYTNGRGKRVDKNPLGIKQMLSAYEEEVSKQRERGEGGAARA